AKRQRSFGMRVAARGGGWRDVGRKLEFRRERIVSCTMRHWRKRGARKPFIEIGGHPLDIPVEEFLDLVFVRRVGTGLIAGTSHTGPGPADERGVLFVRLAPNPGEVVEIVILALDSVLVDEPGRAHQGPLGCQRKDREDDRVVAQEMIPGVW